jgi:hypothetical protein
MKKLIIGLTLAMIMASVAMAGTQVVEVGYAGSPYGPYQANPGGEFTLHVMSGGLDLSSYSHAALSKTSDIGVFNTFQTFCLEGNEYIYPNPKTYDYALSSAAVAGGMGGAVGGKDPISVGTRWLYSQFASGNWQNGLAYYYGDGSMTASEISLRKASALALQKAIWWLEGEENIGYDSNNIYMKEVKAKFGDQAALTAGAQYGVSVLNLTNGSERGQDQLYYHVPDGGSTVMLLGLAFGGISFVSRFLRK